jgi:hypothetical protein
MPKYNEESVTGTIDKTRYEYAHQINAYNPLNGQSKITFKTCTVELDNNTGKEVTLGFKRNLEEPYVTNENFDLINPSDGSVVGSMDYDTVYLALYSLFFHVAAKTDV